MRTTAWRNPLQITTRDSLKETQKLVKEKSKNVKVNGKKSNESQTQPEFLKNVKVNSKKINEIQTQPEFLKNVKDNSKKFNEI